MHDVVCRVMFGRSRLPTATGILNGESDSRQQELAPTVV